MIHDFMIYLCFRLQRFKKAAQSKDSSIVRKNIGRPTSIPNETSLQTETACSTKLLRSSTESYVKTLCIICQKRKTSENTQKSRQRGKASKCYKQQKRSKLKVFSYS